jgi:hypothetical protein
MFPPPPSPGMSGKGAFDALVVLSAAASVSTLAINIWSAYAKFIAPRKAPDDDAGIALVIPTAASPLEFWIGNHYRDRKLFVEEFTAKVESVRHGERDGEATDHVLAEVKLSPHWVRRNKLSP